MERLLRTDIKIFSIIPLMLGIIIFILFVNARADEHEKSASVDTDVNVAALARQIAFVKSFSITYPYQYPQQTQPGGNNPGMQSGKKTPKKVRLK